MTKINEFQVKAYSMPYPKKSIVEVARGLEAGATPGALRDMLVYVAKMTDGIGYTMSELCES